MRETRKLVTGSYVNKSTYVLRTEDGNIFQVIKEGEPFKIGDQMRAFMPVRVPKKNGHGTILMCQKRDNNNFLLEQFPLLHRKKGLWALTSGAARNGVFHTYHEPQGELEAYIASQNTSPKIIERVSSIDNLPFEVGGPWSGEYVRPWGRFVYTDGKVVNNFDSKGKSSQQYTAWVTNATYAIYIEKNTYLNGIHYITIERVILTPQANEEKVLEELKSL